MVQPHVLLVPFTGSRHVVEHFEMLTFQLECNVDFALHLDGRHRGPYELIIQMGLGATPRDREINGEGLRLLKTLRRRFPDTPILVISGHDPSYACEKVKSCGADDYLQRMSANEIQTFVERVRSLLKTAQ